MGAGCCSDIGKGIPENTMLQTSIDRPVPALPEKVAPPTATTLESHDDVRGPNTIQDAQVQDSIMVSDVGELPKFNRRGSPWQTGQAEAPQEGNVEDDECSDASGLSKDSHGFTDVVDEATTKAQRQQAKAVVKDFVKQMVRGRKMNVIAQNGQLRPCMASFNRNLDSLKIKLGGKSRSIALRDIDEIYAGEDVEGVSTPLDELCATLMLASGDCITFRFADIEDRDTFVMCTLMFCNNQK